MKKRTVRFIGLNDKILAFAQPDIRAGVFKNPPHHGRGIGACRMKRRGRHGSSGGFSVGAAYGHGFFKLGYF